MKYLSLLILTFLLISCSSSPPPPPPPPPPPITFNGAGSYQQLQNDRYQCLKETTQRYSAISGLADTSSSYVRGKSEVLPNCSAFNACLGAKGWKRNYRGTGIPVATEIKCKK
tara:strand:- start:419 stop:757 length:339 start_codon:yes stop_codon:yes gene_type:complete